MAIKSILILNHSGFDSHSHTHSMVLHSYVLPAKRLWSWGDFFFWRRSATHWAHHTHNLKWPAAWNAVWADLGHADSQVEQFLPVRQYSRSLHDFHETFYTGFHPSTSWKCVTGHKTLGFFRESCHCRFATMSAIAGNSHYSPMIRGIKQTLISGPG